MNIEELRLALAKIKEAAHQSPQSLPPETVAALSEVEDLLGNASSSELADLKLVPRRENIGSLLLKLSELTKFGKQEWIDLAEGYGIKLDLNPRDSARDVMGKLARHLRANPAAMAEVAAQSNAPKTTSGKGSTRGKRHLAEDLQETLTRLLEE